ncbi:MAG: PVC-type heme-binding CxxCH protein [Planctomycetaceae bacterium]
MVVRPLVASAALLIAAVLSLALPLSAQEPQTVRVPDGFEATLYADDDLAHDIFSLTIDSFGRVVVSGLNYVKILQDTNGDGRADTASNYADGPQSGAQGMYFYGRDLLCSGDQGLLRYRDRNGDDRADGPPDVFLKIKAGGEHDLHAIRKGPDGWWYLIAGNKAGVTAEYATLETSPVKTPHAGAILRLTPDLKKGEIIAHGFRNAYDFDFGAIGDVFTFDSDGEREISLPWYQPTRAYHVLPGSHAGWITENWKRPSTFCDMPPTVAALGRGSPTGVVCYQHTQFPAPFRGALFLLDWTYGRVIAIPLGRAGSTWTGNPIDFMTAVGQYGFAPTDADVGPDGSLYIAVGGRGTRGGVYRVRSTQSPPVELPPVEKQTSPLQKMMLCLQSPQPLSSWSRRRWEPLADAIGGEPFVRAAFEERRAVPERIRAIEILTEKFGGLTTDMAQQLSATTSTDVRARIAWSLGRTQTKQPPAALMSRLLIDPDPLVVRTALEALQGAEPQAFTSLTTPLAQQLGHQDAFVRQMAVRLLALVDEDSYHTIAAAAIPRGWPAAVPVAEGFTLRKPGFNAYAIDIGTRVLSGKNPMPLKYDAARLIEIGLGDLTPDNLSGGAVFEAYTAKIDLAEPERAAALEPFKTKLLSLFPTGDPAVDRELVRILAMLQPDDEALRGRLLAAITPDSHPTDDLHLLIALARLPGPRSELQQKKTGAALLAIDRKVQDRHLRQDLHWNDRLLELYAALAERDPGLPASLLAQPEFGRPAHVQFVSSMPPERFGDAIKLFVGKVRADENYQWDPDVIFLLGASDDPEVRNMLRLRFDDYSLRNAILMTLSQQPSEIDRPLFVEGLEGTPFDVLGQCITALALLPPKAEPREIVALVRSLRRLGFKEQEREFRDQVVELLRLKTGQDFGYELGKEGDPQQPAIDGWSKWVEATYPEEFAAQTGTATENLDDLHALLAQVDWNTGTADRGAKVFQTRQCSQCHNSRTALGPDLSGAAGRFSRDDLFTAIALPNKDVSPRYQATSIITKDGQVHSGMIVYESVDGLVLRNATNQTLRIETEEIETKHTLNTSLMPTGLLKELKPADLADLYAYLRSIGSQTQTAKTQETSAAE